MSCSRGWWVSPSLSSFHRRVRKLRRFLEPLRRGVLSEMVGDPETLLIDSTLLTVFHPSRSPRVLGLFWRCVGEVGFVQLLRCEAAPHLRHQRGAYLLRAYPRQGGGGLLERGAPGRGDFGERSGEEASLGELAYRSEG